MTPESLDAILNIDQINTFYGQSHALQGVSLSIHQGEVVCLLGRNGVGKTTTLRSIMGLTPPRSGRILFKGIDVMGKHSFQIAQMGIGYVPDDRRIFPDLTLFENLELARRLSKKANIQWTFEKIYDLFPVFIHLKERKGNQLSGGEQKMLAIGRALMKNPDLLLLDEPSEGLAPLVVQNLVEVLGRVRSEGVTILLADQNLKFCRKTSDRGYILEKGMIQYQGIMEEIWKNEAIVKKYLVV
ncbi:MAG: amino acid/amide transporter ATP-binding protein 2, family [Deltaproteobacteria bacterium]|jgi:branched-chain amino acid transport system ATP-binding protein|nr:amino acid/amide transporter ATP-binding protein 2, family [Deltaproteobacteria bacterium]